MNKYIINHFIGKGSCGNVYKVRHESEGYALKKVKLLRNLTQTNRSIFNELMILKHCHCPYILKLHEAFLDRSYLCLITPYANQGNLYQRIRKYKSEGNRFDEEVIWSYFIQIALGVKYLHDNNIIHRDLKSSNLFIHRNTEKKEIIKIGDFGISKIIYDNIKSCTVIGTPLYMSPEVLNQRNYDKKIDLWAMGCILFEMIELRPPFTASTFYHLSKKIRLGRYRTCGKRYSNNLTSLIPHLLETNTSARYTINDLLLNCSVISHMIIAPFSENDFKEADPQLYKKIRIPRRIIEWDRLVKGKKPLEKIRYLLPDVYAPKKKRYYVKPNPIKVVRQKCISKLRPNPIRFQVPSSIRSGQSRDPLVIKIGSRHERNYSGFLPNIR